jgi:peptidoglycan/LPS O-acetylase OafA/YrhL
MSEYLSFWLAKIVVEMAVAAVLIAILLAVYFFQWIDGYIRKWRWESAKRKAQEK